MSWRFLACLMVVAAASSGCARAEPHPENAATDVHELALPDLTTELPDLPGRGLVVGSCVTCHSARYILDQPAFPRKIWTAEVSKMVKTYGAPVPPDNAAAIVDYLVLAHGRED